MNPSLTQILYEPFRWMPLQILCRFYPLSDQLPRECFHSNIYFRHQFYVIIRTQIYLYNISIYNVIQWQKIWAFILGNREIGAFVPWKVYTPKLILDRVCQMSHNIWKEYGTLKPFVYGSYKYNRHFLIYDLLPMCKQLVSNVTNDYILSYSYILYYFSRYAASCCCLTK